MIALIVPVFLNFKGFAELLESVDVQVLPIVISNWKENIGVSAAWNQGIDRARDAGCDRALVVNDDATLFSGVISQLSDRLNDKRILVTPVNSKFHDISVEEEFVESPDFACFMVNPQVFFGKVGRFDENFTPAYYEDNDMHRRIILSDHVAGHFSHLPFYHECSVTQNWNGKKIVSSEIFEKNKSYYLEKWGGLPREERFTTPFGKE